MHAGGKLAIAGVALGGVALVSYVIHERRVQREAQAELLALRASLTSDTSHAELRLQVDATRHLFLDDTGRQVAVLTPLSWDAANLVLWLEYREEKPCTAKVRIYDDRSMPAGGGPPDLAFPCAGAGALQNNEMQLTRSAPGGTERGPRS